MEFFVVDFPMLCPVIRSWSWFVSGSDPDSDSVIDNNKSWSQTMNLILEEKISEGAFIGGGRLIEGVAFIFQPLRKGGVYWRGGD